ncbi:MAG TPA: aldo/keto reductase, partial [Polyangiaceae bacterium]|nr:aldo/keto reductase [Polyangiaceae bacterium]
IGQGTWHLEDDSPAAAIAAVQRGIELGMTHIDTAELYGSGKVEAVLAKAIAGRREQLFLVSKVMPSNASFDGTLRSCERSLRHLGTDHLDCYLLHWPGQHALADTFGAFERLVEQGKIRSYGVSNFDEDELAAAIDVAGAGRIVCNQVLYNLTERGIEHAVLPLCEENDIAVVGYTPFGTSTFPPRGPGGQKLTELAQRRGVTVRQLTLAFLTRRPALFAIPKSGNAAHTEENAGSGDLVLDASDVAAIEAAFPLGKRRRGIAML